ncbi:MAG: 3'-5' exonuclease, partial [Patescibacteria group bacterium]
LAGRVSDLSLKDKEKLKRFEVIKTRLHQEMSGHNPLAEFLKRLIKTIGYEEYVADFSKDGESRLENIRELVSLARKYDALPIGQAVTKLLEEIALASDQDELKAGDDRVKLMTLHSAKGLEFPVVFVSGLEEGILPHAKSIQNGRAELEEERRLAYVGMTRAKKRLYLTWAIARTLFGDRQINMPSRFLRELPKEMLESNEALADETLIVDEE